LFDVCDKKSSDLILEKVKSTEPKALEVTKKISANDKRKTLFINFLM
jgi:hypothetical protein